MLFAIPDAPAPQGVASSPIHTMIIGVGAAIGKGLVCPECANKSDKKIRQISVFGVGLKSWERRKTNKN